MTLKTPLIENMNVGRWVLVKMQINMLWSCIWQQEILKTFPDLGVYLSPGYPTSPFLLQAR